MKSNIELSDLVRELLESYTQAELAKESGVDQSTISKLKNNAINPRHDKGEKLRTFYLAFKSKKGRKKARNKNGKSSMQGTL